MNYYWDLWLLRHRGSRMTWMRPCLWKLERQFERATHEKERFYLLFDDAWHRINHVVGGRGIRDFSDALFAIESAHIYKAFGKRVRVADREWRRMLPSD